MQPNTNTPQTDHVIQTLIPTKNKPALFAYYFGVFGFMPLLGIPLSVTAIVLGYKGLRQYRINPTPGAKGHAISGIVMGAIQVLLFTAFVVFMIVVKNTKV